MLFPGNHFPVGHFPALHFGGTGAPPPPSLLDGVLRAYAAADGRVLTARPDGHTLTHLNGG